MVTAHLPESWHHNDEDFEGALEEINLMLHNVGAHEGHILMGCDANAGHAAEDIDEHHFGAEGAAEGNNVRNQAWTNFVRANGLRATNSWTSTRSTRGSWITEQMGRRKHIDMVLTNVEDAETWVEDSLHTRSDHRPLVTDWQAEKPELMHFKGKPRQDGHRWRRRQEERWRRFGTTSRRSRSSRRTSPRRSRRSWGRSVAMQRL